MPTVDSVVLATRQAKSALVDRTTHSTTPISAEARGLARDFCRRVGEEARRLNQQAIAAPLRHRIARYPDRRPREGMLRDLERSWREAQPQQFRLQFDCTWRGRDVWMQERAVTVLNAFRLPHWDANDYGIEVVDTWFEVSRRRIDAGMRSRMWIGSHALARWYQRSGARSDARLLQDIGIGAAAHPQDVPDPNNVRISVDLAASWRGAIMLAPEAEEDEPVFYARTFI
jgi:hypothetical protein